MSVGTTASTVGRWGLLANVAVGNGGVSIVFVVCVRWSPPWKFSSRTMLLMFLVLALVDVVVILAALSSSLR